MFLLRDDIMSPFWWKEMRWISLKKHLGSASKNIVGKFKRRGSLHHDLILKGFTSPLRRSKKNQQTICLKRWE